MLQRIPDTRTIRIFLHIRFIRMNRMAPSLGADRPGQAADGIPRRATSQPA